MNVTGQGGKGSRRRKEDKSKFDEGFDRIFGTKNNSKERSGQAVGDLDSSSSKKANK